MSKDYLKVYGVKNFRKFQEGGPAAAPEAQAAPAPQGGGGEVEAAIQLVMQIVEAAASGDPQAGEIIVQIAQAISGGGAGGAEGGAPPVAKEGSMVYRRGGEIGAPLFTKRSALVPRR